MGMHPGRMIDMTYDAGEMDGIVTMLADEYTGGRSSSVTYEIAGQLIGAANYCLDMAEKDCGAVIFAGTKLMSIYEKGYGSVVEKTRSTQAKYGKMIGSFTSFGNRAYEDTIVSGMPAFFRNYDPRFCPQDHILMLDYPVISRLEKLNGIKRISSYLDCVIIEQRYLSMVPDGYVREVLRKWNRDYENMIFNVAAVVHRSVIGRALAHGSADMTPYGRDEMDALAVRICGLDITSLRSLADNMTDRMIGEDAELATYLKGDCEDMCVEMKTAAEHGVLDRVLV